jgi:hypothetical protein
MRKNQFAFAMRLLGGGLHNRQWHRMPHNLSAAAQPAHRIRLYDIRDLRNLLINKAYRVRRCCGLTLCKAARACQAARILSDSTGGHLWEK